MAGDSKRDTTGIKGERVTENICLCPDGTYRWIYELSMIKNPILLITIFKVLGISVLSVCAFVVLVDLIEDGHITPTAAGEGKILLLVLAGFVVLTVISYLILASIYGWKYIVLFEMDDKKVTHIQMSKQFEKAQALGWLAAMSGLAAGSYTAAGSGILASDKNTSTAEFEDVRTVRGIRSLHTIKVNQLLERNQVYADASDYDFVWDYITERCINAKIR